MRNWKDDNQHYAADFFLSLKPTYEELKDSIFGWHKW